MMSKAVDMKSLFAGVKNQPKEDRSYSVVEHRFKNPKLGAINDMNVITKWFQMKYEKKYGVPMIGYNYFNCRKTFQQIGTVYGMSNWEVCQFVDMCFNRFHSLGYDKVSTDNKLTLSIMKTGWIVQGMYANRRPGESARNSSFKQHGVSRRQSSPTIKSESVIHSKGF